MILNVKAPCIDFWKSIQGALTFCGLTLLFTWLMLVRLQSRVFGLVFRGNPSSSVGGTVFLVRLRARLDRHDEQLLD